MCSQMDDPSQYSAPEPVKPRTYVLSGDAAGAELRAAALEHRPASLALAVLGEMLTEAEQAEDAGAWPLSNTVETLREARNRVMAAEAKL